MSTIILNGNTLSGRLGIGSYMSMGNSFSNARSSTSNLSSELGHLRNKIDAVNTSVNVDGSQATTAKTREENKSSALTCGYDKLDTLVSDVGIVDNKTATEVEKLKKDFYNKYGYLKPDSEKSWWDRVKDGAGKLWDKVCDINNKINKFFADVIEWCKEHIVAIITALVVIIVAVVLAVFLGPVAVAAIFAAISFFCDAADTVSTWVTGKDIYHLLSDSGHPILAEIFGGVKWGSTIAATALSFYNLGKEIGKVGLKQFLTNGQKGFVNILKSHLKNFWNGMASDFTSVFGKGKTFGSRLKAVWNIVVLNQSGDFSFKGSINAYRNGDKIIRVGLDSPDVSIDENGKFVPKSDELKKALSDNGFGTDELLTKRYGRSTDWDWDVYGTEITDIEFIKMYQEGKIPIKNGQIDKSKLRNVYWKEAGVKPISGKTTIHELYDIKSGKLKLYEVNFDIHKMLRHNGGTSQSVKIMNDMIRNNLFGSQRQTLRRNIFDLVF